MHKLKRTTLFALAAVPLTAGLVLAASGSGTAPVQPAQPGLGQSQSGQAQPGTTQTQPAQSGTNSADVFLQKLAAALGVSVERLRAAAVQAGNATIDQAVQAGDLSGERATRMKEHLQDAPLNFSFGRGGFGGHDHAGRGGGRGFGHHHGDGEWGGFGSGRQDQGSAPAQEDTGAAGMGT